MTLQQQIPVMVVVFGVGIVASIFTRRSAKQVGRFRMVAFPVTLKILAAIAMIPAIVMLSCEIIGLANGVKAISTMSLLIPFIWFLCAVFLVIEVYFTKLLFNDKGVVSYRLLRGKRMYRYSEIAAMKRFSAEWRITAKGKSAFWIWDYCYGQRELVEKIKYALVKKEKVDLR